MRPRPTIRMTCILPPSHVGGSESVRRRLLGGDRSAEPPWRARRDASPTGRPSGAPARVTSGEAARGDDVEQLAAPAAFSEVANPSAGEALGYLDVETLRPSIIRFAYEPSRGAAQKSSRQTALQRRCREFWRTSRTAADFVTPGDLYRAVTLTWLGYVAKPIA